MANKHEKWGSNKTKRNVNYNDETPLPAPQEEQDEFDKDEKTFPHVDRGSNWKTTLENVC